MDVEPFAQGVQGTAAVLALEAPIRAAVALNMS
jgi:hypothetical protein